MSMVNKSITDQEFITECQKIVEKNPDRVPILVRAKNFTMKDGKKKFLVENSVSIGQFQDILRRRYVVLTNQNPHTVALYSFINGHIHEIGKTLKEICDLNKTHYLIIEVATENTFG